MAKIMDALWVGLIAGAIAAALAACLGCGEASSVQRSASGFEVVGDAPPQISVQDQGSAGSLDSEFDDDSGAAQAERDSRVYEHMGSFYFRDDDNAVYRHDGTGWRPYSQRQSSSQRSRGSQCSGLLCR
jgi:hypothetical protein